MERQWQMDKEIFMLRQENDLLKSQENRVKSAITWFKWVVGTSVPLFIIGIGWLISVERNLSSIRNDIEWIKRIVAQETGSKPYTLNDGRQHAEP